MPLREARSTTPPPPPAGTAVGAVVEEGPPRECRCCCDAGHDYYCGEGCSYVIIIIW